MEKEYWIKELTLMIRWALWLHEKRLRSSLDHIQCNGLICFQLATGRFISFTAFAWRKNRLWMLQTQHVMANRKTFCDIPRTQSRKFYRPIFQRSIISITIQGMGWGVPPYLTMLFNLQAAWGTYLSVECFFWCASYNYVTLSADEYD